MFDWLWEWLDKLQDWCKSLLPDWMGSGFDALGSAMGPSAQYLAYLGGLDAVIPIIIGAYIVKFSIRRIPVIG